MQDGDPVFPNPPFHGIAPHGGRFGRTPADSDGAPRYLATPPRRIAWPPRKCVQMPAFWGYRSSMRSRTYMRAVGGGITVTSHHGADQKGEPDHGPLCGLAEEEVLADHMNGTLPRLVRSAPDPSTAGPSRYGPPPLVRSGRPRPHSRTSPSSSGRNGLRARTVCSTPKLVLPSQDPGQTLRVRAVQIGGAARRNHEMS